LEGAHLLSHKEEENNKKGEENREESGGGLSFFRKRGFCRIGGSGVRREKKRGKDARREAALRERP